MKPESVKRLEEIAAAIEEIANFTRGKTEADYLTDSMLRSAVLWQLVRVCEAVRSLAQTTRQSRKRSTTIARSSASAPC